VDSVTGHLPRNPPPPALYAPETITAARVACASRPRAEVTIGGESPITEVLGAIAGWRADHGLHGSAPRG